MNRDSMNDSQTRELTEAELDAVSGGSISSGGDRPTESAMVAHGGGGGGAGKSLVPAV
jgi:hypothetical protein